LGIRLTRKGLVMMDSPGREPEILTGLAAAGCNIVAFTTGRGAPKGFHFVSVCKIAASPKTWAALQDHMNIYVDGIAHGEETLT
jgi:altronate dehydratase large subunit